jgi:hypothetical protein
MVTPMIYALQLRLITKLLLNKVLTPPFSIMEEQILSAQLVVHSLQLAMTTMLQLMNMVS